MSTLSMSPGTPATCGRASLVTLHPRMACAFILILPVTFWLSSLSLLPATCHLPWATLPRLVPPCVVFGTQTLPLVSRVMFHVASASGPVLLFGLPTFRWVSSQLGRCWRFFLPFSRFFFGYKFVFHLKFMTTIASKCLSVCLGLLPLPLSVRSIKITL